MLGGGRKFPLRGRYTLRAAEAFPAEAFGSNKAGTALTIQIDPVIVGPTNEGYQLKFNSGRISAKTFKRGTEWVSQLGDFLKACGVTGKVPGDPQAQADLAEQTAGRVFEAELDWRAYDKTTGREYNSIDEFPKNEAGEPQPYVLSATEKDDSGQPKRIWANLQITKFIPQA